MTFSSKSPVHPCASRKSYQPTPHLQKSISSPCSGERTFAIFPRGPVRLRYTSIESHARLSNCFRRPNVSREWSLPCPDYVRAPLLPLYCNALLFPLWTGAACFLRPAGSSSFRQSRRRRDLVSRPATKTWRPFYCRRGRRYTLWRPAPPGRSRRIQRTNFRIHRPRTCPVRLQQ